LTSRLSALFPGRITLPESPPLPQAFDESSRKTAQEVLRAVALDTTEVRIGWMSLANSTVAQPGEGSLPIAIRTCRLAAPIRSSCPRQQTRNNERTIDPGISPHWAKLKCLLRSRPYHLIQHLRIVCDILLHPALEGAERDGPSPVGRFLGGPVHAD
jgi:hypothetical protein